MLRLVTQLVPVQLLLEVLFVVPSCGSSAGSSGVSFGLCVARVFFGALLQALAKGRALCLSCALIETQVATALVGPNCACLSRLVPMGPSLFPAACSVAASWPKGWATR